MSDRAAVRPARPEDVRQERRREVRSVLARVLSGGVRGIEFGSGFACARMRGSECNDAICSPDGTTATNHAGGINGGITNGNELVFRIAVKPTSSIRVPQQTVSLKTGQPTRISVTGRHDACIALRVPVIVEAVTATALADLLLIQRGIRGAAAHTLRNTA